VANASSSLDSSLEVHDASSNTDTVIARMDGTIRRARMTPSFKDVHAEWHSSTVDFTDHVQSTA
jgi:hypothetical protein